MERSLPDAEALPPAFERTTPLALLEVRGPEALGVLAAPVPEAWANALAQLRGWLGIAADFAPSAPSHAALQVFAPWQGCIPAAFRHGGAPGLPQADFAASYCIDHARAAPVAGAGVDVVVMSPHPSALAPTHGLPDSALLHAMLRAARDEGRERIAIIAEARHRAAIAALLQGEAGEEETGAEILAIEHALAPLIARRAPWDAVIVMPEWRSVIVTLVAETTGVRGAWPMLWFAEREGTSRLTRVTAELPVPPEAPEEREADSPLPLDAQALIHALALTLHEAGAARAAWRLHDVWARLRDSGVTTAGRGLRDAPYASQLPDAAFIGALCHHIPASHRPQPAWRALKNGHVAIFGTQSPKLRVV